MGFRSEKLKQIWKLVRESNATPLTGETRKPPFAADGETVITFIGHSSFLIQVAGSSILIDPVFALRLILLRRQRRPGLLIRDLPNITAILLTHAHMDHLNLPSLRKVIREMRRRRVPLPAAIMPEGVQDLVNNLGFDKVIPLNWWESTQIADLTITLTPAKHWGARMFKDTHRGFGGYTIAAPGSPTIYHSGDTAYFAGFREIAARLHPPIALLPIGAYFPDTYRHVHTSPEEALQAFLDLQGERMVPMHYNTFRLGREPMDEPLPRLLAEARRLGVETRIRPLTEGESFTPMDVLDSKSLTYRAVHQG